MLNSHFDPALSRSLARSLSFTTLFLKRQLWIWPLIAAALLVVIGVWVHRKIDLAITDKLRSELKAVLNADVKGLEIWLQSQKSNATSAARSPDVQRIVGELLAVAAKPGSTALDFGTAPATAELKTVLQPLRREHGYSGYMVADTHQRIIASYAPELLDQINLNGYSDFLPEVLSGKATVSHPFPSLIVLTDGEGRSSVGQPTMYAAVPVYDATGTKVIAALGLRLRPDVDFTKILSVATVGESGETYAFNRQGLLLSESRFDEDLKAIGLIPNLPESQSILRLDLRDPGGDMLAGFRSKTKRPELPFTAPVADAITGGTDVNLVGYRDYRGQPSVAAWTWLPQYDFGVVTEIDKAEAYRPLYILRPLFWGLFGLLTALVRDAGPLPEGRVIHILLQLCGSLHEAHEMGLIHRDVKPANIMICRLGGMFDVAKLLDFGLVKAVDAQREAGLTAANDMLGTPLYMSPEAVANPEHVNARSDLYSLGCVGYFLLTGTTVFSGVSLSELFGKHTSAEPEAPSLRLRRSIDPDLEALIMRCLEKSAIDRPGTAEELAVGLGHCASAGGWSTAKARMWWTDRKSNQGWKETVFADTHIAPLGDDGQCLSTIAP